MNEKKKCRKHRKHNSWRKIVMILGAAAVGLLVFCVYSLWNENDIDKNAAMNGEDILTDDSYSGADPISLGNELSILKMGSYEGVFVEDGSDEVVADVMMVLLENQSENDLQYAEIFVEFETVEAFFTVTNLPAGKSAVLLEKNRKAWTKEEVTAAFTENLVFFESPMSILESELKITGQNGSLTIENISGQDINVPMYVYYKNAGGEVFYGGITYRVQLAEGIATGNVVQIAASHFDPDSSVVVAVTKME